MILNDLQHTRSIDKSNMLDVLHRTPAMFEEALGLPTPSRLRKLRGKPRLVAFMGMGGSSIGAGILTDSAGVSMKIPMLHLRDSELPGYVDKNSVAVAVSYSGDTRETVEALLEARRRKCFMLGISSGGLLEKVCVKHDIAHMKIPRGYLPRCALPFLLTSTIKALEALGIARGGCAQLQKAISALRALNQRIGMEVPAEKNRAKQLAAELNGKIPFVYGYREFVHTAYRIKTQLNENSKVPAMFGVLPEACHNDIVTWRGGTREDMGKISILLIRSPSENREISVRLNFIKSTLTKRGAKVLEIQAEGSTPLERALSTIYFGDFVSFYLAVLRGVDPSSTPGISELKAQIDGEPSYRETIEATLSR